MIAFPIVGPVRFEDTWGAPRSGGRTHKGVDLYADEGAPVVAVEDGTIFQSTSALSGIGLNLVASKTRIYHFAHLSAVEGKTPRKVKAGDVIGYVGATGNAAGGPPHLHFEQVESGEKINPFDSLKAAQRQETPKEPPKLAPIAARASTAHHSRPAGAPWIAWVAVGALAWRWTKWRA